MSLLAEQGRTLAQHLHHGTACAEQEDLPHTGSDTCLILAVPWRGVQLPSFSSAAICKHENPKSQEQALGVSPGCKIG